MIASEIKGFFYFLILLLFFQCKKPTTVSYPNTDASNSIEAETYDLKAYTKLIDFFQNGICEASPEDQSFKVCISTFWNRTERTSERILINELLAEQDFMFSKLDTKVLNNIWLAPQNSEPLKINPKGEYLQILSNSLTEFPILIEYHNSIKTTGKIPVHFRQQFKTLGKNDWDNQSMQLILAVHYFTLNKIKN